MQIRESDAAGDEQARLEEIDLESFRRFHTGVCAVCGENDLTLGIHDAGSCRYLGWSCPQCDLTGILAIYPGAGD